MCPRNYLSGLWRVFESLVSPTLDFTCHEDARSPALGQLEDRAADSDLSDRLVIFLTSFCLSSSYNH